jgi:hypothetical protein
VVYPYKVRDMTPRLEAQQKQLTFYGKARLLLRKPRLLSDYDKPGLAPCLALHVAHARLLCKAHWQAPFQA